MAPTLTEQCNAFSSSSNGKQICGGHKRAQSQPAPERWHQVRNGLRAKALTQKEAVEMNHSNMFQSLAAQDNTLDVVEEHQFPFIAALAELDEESDMHSAADKRDKNEANTHTSSTGRECIVVDGGGQADHKACSDEFENVLKEHRMCMAKDKLKSLAAWIAV